MTRRITLPRESGSARTPARTILAALALTLAAMASGAHPALADSLDPAWQTIVLKGATMPQLIGSLQSHLEVLALHNGHLRPVPFQVDKLLPDGRYLLPDGSEPAADDSHKILGRDDEIAMMLSDLGDHASPPPRELAPDALEIEVLDTARGTRRYAYMAAVPSPRLSRISYVKYDPALNTVEGEGYRMTFRGDFPIGLALRDNGGNFSPSLIENSQMQVTARVLRLFKLRLGVKGMTSRVLGWHQGPIRLIRCVTHSVKLIFGIKTPAVLSEEIFYRARAEDSLVARVPWVPRLFFDHVRLRTWFDFNRPDGLSLSWPGTMWQPLAPAAAVASLTAAVRKNPPEVKWLALRGSGRIVMHTFAPSPDLALLRRQLYYCDGAAVAGISRTPPDCASGALQIGYLMTGWENLAPATHRVDSILLILPGRAAPDEVARELAAPPLVNVRPLRR